MECVEAWYKEKAWLFYLSLVYLTHTKKLLFTAIKRNFQFIFISSFNGCLFYSIIFNV